MPWLKGLISDSHIGYNLGGGAAPGPTGVQIMVRSTAVPQKRTAQRDQRSRYRPIDMAHLARQTLGDRGLEQEVLRMFDDATRTYYGRLERSTSVDDLLRHLHTLKGAALGVGARAIAQLAAAAESDLRGGLPVNPEQIHDLGMAIAECSAFIESMLDEDGE